VQHLENPLPPGKTRIAWERYRPDKRRRHLYLKILKQILKRQTKEATEMQPVMGLGNCLISLPATNTLRRDFQSFCQRFLRQMTAQSFLTQTLSKIHRCLQDLSTLFSLQ
jgi:hypothetical protein